MLAFFSIFLVAQSCRMTLTARKHVSKEEGWRQTQKKQGNAKGGEQKHYLLFQKDGLPGGFLKCSPQTLTGSATAEGQTTLGHLLAGLQACATFWGSWGQNLGRCTLGLTCNSAQPLNSAPSLARCVGSQAVADEVDLGRRVVVVCLQREDYIFRTFLYCGILIFHMCGFCNM